MKTAITTSLLFTVLVLGTPTWAYTIGGGAASVGDIDDIIATTSIGHSSSAAEENWVESVLGFDVTFEYKNDGAFAWSAVDGEANIFAQELHTDPGYYLVKLGRGNFSGDTHVLYENLASLSYAVIDLEALGQGATIDIARVSHISEFGGTSTIPEPATLALLGLGLLGLRATARSQTN